MVDTFRYAQKFASNLHHIGDYLELVNRFYATWQLAAETVTYYNLDIENSNIDKSKLNGGSYEMIGDLSGWKWRKVLAIQINGTEPVSMTPIADEKGVTNSEKLTTAYFPKIYELQPNVHDFVSYECMNTNNNYRRRQLSLFEVVNVEQNNDFDFGFFKVSMKISYVLPKQLDCQLSGVYTLVDYEKQIYPIDQSIILNELLNERTKNKLKSYFDQNCGLYCENLG